MQGLYVPQCYMTFQWEQPRPSFFGTTREHRRPPSPFFLLACSSCKALATSPVHRSCAFDQFRSLFHVGAYISNAQATQISKAEHARRAGGQAGRRAGGQAGRQAAGGRAVVRQGGRGGGGERNNTRGQLVRPGRRRVRGFARSEEQAPHLIDPQDMASRSQVGVDGATVFPLPRRRPPELDRLPQQVPPSCLVRSASAPRPAYETCLDTASL
jgi:hypothetical protein